MRPSRWLAMICLLSLNVAAGDPSRLAPADVEVVVAARDLAAGETVTSADLAKRTIPAKLITSSMVKIDSAQYIVSQRLQLPVLKGGILTWGHFEMSSNHAILDGCLEAEKLPSTAIEQIARARQAVLQRTQGAPRSRP